MIEDGVEVPGPFLVLAPHPDDDVLGCGGFIAKAIAQGDRVQVIYLTSGEQGAPGQEPAVVLEWRERDARRAAEYLGIESVHFLEYPDGSLWRMQGDVAEMADVRARILTLLSQQDFDPITVLLPHGEEEHRDHAGTYSIGWQVFRGRAPNFLSYEVWTPMATHDLSVDISDYLDMKLTAIRMHVSQVWRIAFDDAAEGLARFRGALHNRPHGPYAEVFKWERSAVDPETPLGRLGWQRDAAAPVEQ